MGRRLYPGSLPGATVAAAPSIARCGPGGRVGMTSFEPGATALLEPLALAGGIATFLLLASLAAGPPGDARISRDRGSVETGPLAIEATLSQSALASDEDGTV